MIRKIPGMLPLLPMPWSKVQIWAQLQLVLHPLDRLQLAKAAALRLNPLKIVHLGGLRPGDLRPH